MPHPTFSAYHANLARLTASIDGLDAAFLKETSTSAEDAIVDFLRSTPVGKKALLLITGGSGTGARNLAVAVSSVISVSREEEGIQCACYLGANLLHIKTILEGWDAPDTIKKTSESRNMLIASCDGPSADQVAEGGVPNLMSGAFNKFDRVLSITLTTNGMGKPAVVGVHKMFQDQGA